MIPWRWRRRTIVAACGCGLELPLRVPSLCSAERVILSGDGPFACEWAGGVEGPLVAKRTCSEWNRWVGSRMKFESASVQVIGVLRLRGDFAPRSRYFAQDDRVLVKSSRVFGFLP